MSDETRATRDINRLIKTARELLPHLHASDDTARIFMTDLVARSPESAGERLRREADLADARDEAIKKFRIAVAQFE